MSMLVQQQGATAGFLGNILLAETSSNPLKYCVQVCTSYTACLTSSSYNYTCNYTYGDEEECGW